jgi:hypothetical protein
MTPLEKASACLGEAIEILQREWPDHWDGEELTDRVDVVRRIVDLEIKRQRGTR